MNPTFRLAVAQSPWAANLSECGNATILARCSAMTPAKQKNELRARIHAVLKSFPQQQRVAASAQACSQLLLQSAWQCARTVLFFAPMPEELDLWPCLETAVATGKRVCLPRTIPGQDAYAAAEVRELRRDVVPGRFGIREPAPHCAEVPLNRLDLILVPGLAFDRVGHRLGRGKGHYDRWLTARSGLTCGVAFDEQLVDAVPLEPHDLIVDCILTPSRWLEVSPQRAVLD